MKNWTLEVKEHDDGEFFIELNDEILTESGFKIGDELEWIDNENGSWTLKKTDAADKVWVMVDTVFTYRMRYCVETPKDHPEYALDTVTCEEGKEFSQLPLGETIVSHRVVTKEEALEMCDVDNDYCSSWTDELKIKTFLTKEGEKAKI
jgi:hypothetical protein